MADSVITYETFRKFQRLEKDNDAIQKLPDSFYEACREWIKRKEALYETTRDSSLLREIENMMSVVKDIMDRRERKLLTLALHHVRGGALPQNLLPSEKGLFDLTVAGLENARKANLEKIRGTQKAVQEQARPEERQQPAPSQQVPYLKVSVLQKLERFVGTDGKVYGPMNPGDTVELPSDVAKLLLEKNMAAPT